ncbi:MAG: flagellar basal body P-ring protein FlgI [Phycisphaerae bacterium]|jgi:flagellar P-ring protein precursor FlgI
MTWATDIMPERNKKVACRVLALVAVIALALPAGAERVKDIVDIQGIRSNPLWGYGLVVGLEGTGDNSPSSRRALTNILHRMGMTMEIADINSKNIASVLVTADLPPFGRKGGEIDVTVSAIGDATSLRGGMLLLTPLVGADGEVYAVAQGAISLGGGFSATGKSASVQKNHSTVGRIPAGATIEREEVATFLENGFLAMQLRNGDFSTAQTIAQAINGLYPESALAVDSGSIRVAVPADLSRAQLPGFIDSIGGIQVKVDFPAVVIINERTGTIVVGENVGISTVAISHGNLSIVTQEKESVSQPEPFSNTGTTEKTNRTEISAVEEKGTMFVVPRKVSVQELAQALNAMGLTPGDMIAIFEALRQAGALQAQLKIM